MTTLHEGDDFGQLALVNDAPRAATIVLREDNCHFLRVDKQDFNRIIKVPLLRVGRDRDMAKTLPWRRDVGQEEGPGRACEEQERELGDGGRKGAWPGCSRRWGWWGYRGILN